MINAGKYLMLFATFLVYSISAVFGKIAATQDTLFTTVMYMGVEFVLLAVYALFWQQMLKKFDLSVAMACKGITVLYGLGFAVALFGETVGVWNIVGAILVMFGIWMVASDG